MARMTWMYRSPNKHMQRSGWHKVHARHRHAVIEISVYAPQVRRAAADVGR